MIKKFTIVGLFAREMGLRLARDIIYDNKFKIVAIVTHYYEPDMKTIRPEFDEYVNLCELFSIPLIIINKNQDNLEILKELNFDFLVSDCYKYIIPAKYLHTAKIGSYNMHRSLLPKYKGLKPLAKALANKDKDVGITFHEISEKVDDGKVINQISIRVNKKDTIESLFNKLYPLQYKLLNSSLTKVWRDING